MPVFPAVADLIRAAVDLLYPPACSACGRDSAEPLCPSCRAALPRLEPPFCAVCSHPLPGAIEGGFTCANCHDRRFHFECAVAAWRARGPVRAMIHRFKYREGRHLRGPLTDLLVEGLTDPRLAGRPIDAIVPVPLHAARLRARRYNQAEVLAETLSARTGLRVLSALRRVRATRTQTRLDREERMENLRGAFVPAHNARVQGLHLVVLDDVFTTGATTHDCARALREAGAASVRVLTVARG